MFLFVSVETTSFSKFSPLVKYKIFKTEPLLFFTKKKITGTTYLFFGQKKVHRTNKNLFVRLSAIDSNSESQSKKEVDLTGDGGVIKTLIESGKGSDIKEGSFVRVHYKGWLENGDIFDSSFERKEPYSFKIGEGKVIKGWEIGVKSMKVGEKAKFSITSAYGYKKKGIPPIIPPNANLFFEIELLDLSLQPQETEGFYNEKFSTAPRTPREISEDFEKRMREKTEKKSGFGNFFFISPFRSQTGEKAPWWLNPNITFVLAAGVLLFAFWTVISIGGIHQGYVDQNFDANLLKKL